MAAERIIFSIQGMEELRSSLDLERIKKDVAIGLGQAATQLHGALNFAIFTRYNSPYNLNAAWRNKSSSTREIGKNVLLRDLEYTNRRVDLSKFRPISFYEGNINSNARRTGLVHEVAVLRGKQKVIFGKSHHGGFMPRKGKTTPILFGSYGTQMFERKTRRKYPLRLLLGPSIGNMLDNVFFKDKNVKAASENFINIILQQLKFL